MHNSKTKTAATTMGICGGSAVVKRPLSPAMKRGNHQSPSPQRHVGVTALGLCHQQEDDLCKINKKLGLHVKGSKGISFVPLLSRILMSAGNGGRQNYGKRRSQRV